MARWRYWGWLAGIAVLVASPYLLAEEPASQFLKLLRDDQHRYYDAAILYLDRMENSPLVPGEFREKITYERGITLLELAATQRDTVTRDQMLADARENLQKFLTAHPDHASAIAARRQLGRMLSWWAKLKMEQVKRSNRPELRKEAAKLYDDAHATHAQARDELKGELAKLKQQLDAAPEQDLAERRKLLQGEYLAAQVYAAQTLEDKAATFDAKSPDRKKVLEEAEKQYSLIFKKYQKMDLLAAFEARMYQARTLMELGPYDAASYDKAQEYLTEDLLARDVNDPSFRALKTKAMLLAFDGWMRNPKKEQFQEAIKHASSWIASVRPNESKEPAWLLLRLRLAKAYKKYAESLKAKNPRDPNAKELYESAAKLTRFVSRVPGAHQQEARTLLTELPGGMRLATESAKLTPKTFEEARAAGQESLAAMRSAQFILENVPKRLAREKDDKIKQELRTTLDQAQDTVARGREKALQYFRLALHLADAETPFEDLNFVRYSLAYLHYLRADYFDAAVLAEFFARRFADAPLASKAAEIALAAYLKLYEENDSDDKRFETAHIVAIANYIVETWSGQEEAITAVNTLIPFLIQQGELAKARKYVENIPPNSPERGSAELRVGQAMWRNYLAGISELRQLEKAAESAGGGQQASIQQRKKTLEQLKNTALGVLQSGVQRMKKAGTMERTVPLAVLSLAQIHVDMDQPDQALKLLNDESIGTLAMMRRKDPMVQDPRLMEQAYKVALSAQVAALPKASDSAQRAQLITAARETMQALKKQVGDSPEGRRRLIGIFFSMARGLQRQLELLDQPEDRRVLSEGFSAFLEQVRSEATDVRILNWVAQSYMSLGNGMAGDSGTSAVARQYFEKAVETYELALKQADTLKLSTKARLQLQVLNAAALRQAGRFGDAIKLFGQVLAKDNRKVSIQVDAAMTFQLWAEQRGLSSHYLDAVRGAVRSKKKKTENVIWGWSLIVRKTQKYRQFRETFHKARYNQALCYFKYAMRQRNDKTRKSYLGKAKSTIVFTQKLYPTMGGKSWRSQYDVLLKKVQRALKERPLGLAATSTRKKKS